MSLWRWPADAIFVVGVVFTMVRAGVLLAFLPTVVGVRVSGGSK
jgi:hypothetical protein